MDQTTWSSAGGKPTPEQSTSTRAAQLPVMLTEQQRGRQEPPGHSKPTRKRGSQHWLSATWMLGRHCCPLWCWGRFLEERDIVGVRQQQRSGWTVQIGRLFLKLLVGFLRCPETCKLPKEQRLWQNSWGFLLPFSFPQAPHSPFTGSVQHPALGKISNEGKLISHDAKQTVNQSLSK